MTRDALQPVLDLGAQTGSAAGAAATETWNCPDCGTQSIASRFCPNCGKKRPESALAGIVKSAEPPTSSQTSAQTAVQNGLTQLGLVRSAGTRESQRISVRTAVAKGRDK